MYTDKDRVGVINKIHLTSLRHSNSLKYHHLKNVETHDLPYLYYPCLFCTAIPTSSYNLHCFFILLHHCTATMSGQSYVCTNKSIFKWKLSCYRTLLWALAAMTPLALHSVVRGKYTEQPLRMCARTPICIRSIYPWYREYCINLKITPLPFDLQVLAWTFYIVNKPLPLCCKNCTISKNAQQEHLCL